MSKLALFGGDAAVSGTLTPFRSHGEEELQAVRQVMNSGVLSDFVGASGPKFLGGPRVRQFEYDSQLAFGVEHAVTFNSWTSGLIAAVGALQLEPGDQVIVPTWTMSATATAILHWNCVPVFADIDPHTFNISIQSIEECITSRTRAVIAVDIFGQSADMDEINLLAKKYDLRVISDSAQAPGALYRGRYAGTLAHIGGYSLNYHKHIHTGEGGIAFTDDEGYAERLQLIRNHGEAVVGDAPESDRVGVLGYNFRLGELEAAIGSAQLVKLPEIIAGRQSVATNLIYGLQNLPGLTMPTVGEDRTHVFYVFALKVDPTSLGVRKDRIVDALLAEGAPVMRRYQNLHLLPVYQKRVAYGTGSLPWSLSNSNSTVRYERGICPTAERINEDEFVGIPTCSYEFGESELEQVLRAFCKVWENLSALQER